MLRATEHRRLISEAPVIKPGPRMQQTRLGLPDNPVRAIDRLELGSSSVASDMKQAITNHSALRFCK